MTKVFLIVGVPSRAMAPGTKSTERYALGAAASGSREVVLGSFALWKGANAFGDGQVRELGGGLALTLTRATPDPNVGVARSCRR
jgi:hypothetical protein